MKQPESSSRYGSLQPCPFCGSSAAFVSKSETYGHGDFGFEWFVSCAAKACGVRMPSSNAYGNPSEDEQKASAVIAWNNRVAIVSERGLIPKDLMDWLAIKMPHNECDDCWYSCATITCDDERKSSICDCGADQENALRERLRGLL